MYDLESKDFFKSRDVNFIENEFTFSLRDTPSQPYSTLDTSTSDFSITSDLVPLLASPSGSSKSLHVELHAISNNLVEASRPIVSPLCDFDWASCPLTRR